MKAKIDKEKCIGCGQCTFTCSEVFEIGDDGFANVKVNEIKEEVKEDAILAKEGCPTEAIEISA